MKAETQTPNINQLGFELPELSLQVVSFLQLATFLVLAVLLYFAGRKFISIINNTGLLESTSHLYRSLNIGSIALPVFIFLYGFTIVSKESLFVSLLFFVIISFVIGFSLADPIRSLFSSMVINFKGELNVGDYIHFGDFEGKILAIGIFNVIVETRGGNRSYIPTNQFMKQSFEIRAKRGGPSILVSYPSKEINRDEFELLASLCPYKRENSEVRVLHIDQMYQLQLEVIDQDCRREVITYFNSYLKNARYLSQY